MRPNNIPLNAATNEIIQQFRELFEDSNPQLFQVLQRMVDGSADLLSEGELDVIRNSSAIEMRSWTDVISHILKNRGRDVIEAASQKIMSALLKLVESSDFRVQRNALRAIANIAIKTNLFADEATKSTLLELTKSSDFGVQQFTLGAIGNIACHNDGQKLFADKATKSALLKLAKSSYLEVQKYAVRAIGNITTHKNGQRLFADEATKSAILGLLEISDLKAQRYAVMAIKNITNRIEGILLFNEEKFRQILFQLRESEDEELRNSAEKSIKNIGFTRPQQIINRIAANDPNLKEVDLHSKKISDDDATEIARALRKNRWLQVLDFGNNRISNKVADEIGRSLSNNTSLKRIYLDDSYISAEKLELIRNQLERNRGLILHLGLSNSKVEKEPVRTIGNIPSYTNEKKQFTDETYFADQYTKSRLIQLTARQDIEDQREAARKIANITNHTDGKKLFADEDTKSALLRLARIPDSEVKSDTAKAITNIATLTEGQILFADEKTKFTLLELAGNFYPEAQKNALIAIANIALHPNGRNIFNNEATKLLLLNLVRSSDSEVKENAIRAVQNITLYYEKPFFGEKVGPFFVEPKKSSYSQETFSDEMVVPFLSEFDKIPNKTKQKRENILSQKTRYSFSDSTQKTDQKDFTFEKTNQQEEIDELKNYVAGLEDKIERMADSIDPRFKKTPQDLDEISHIKKNETLNSHYEALQKNFNLAFFTSSAIATNKLGLRDGKVTSLFNTARDLANAIPAVSSVLSGISWGVDAFAKTRRTGRYSNIVDIIKPADPIKISTFCEKLARVITITSEQEILRHIKANPANFVNELGTSIKSGFGLINSPLSKGLYKISKNPLADQQAKTAMEYILKGELDKEIAQISQTSANRSNTTNAEEKEEAERNKIIDLLVEHTTGLQTKRLPPAQNTFSSSQQKSPIQANNFSKMRDELISQKDREIADLRRMNAELRIQTIRNERSSQLHTQTHLSTKDPNYDFLVREVHELRSQVVVLTEELRNKSELLEEYDNPPPPPTTQASSARKMKSFSNQKMPPSRP